MCVPGGELPLLPPARRVSLLVSFLPRGAEEAERIGGAVLRMRSSAVGGTDWTLQSCPSARPSVIRRWLHDGSSAWLFCLSDACSARSWLIHFANGSTAIQSFSAAFVLDIVSNYTGFSTHRMAIAVALTTASLSAVLTDKYLVGRASPTPRTTMATPPSTTCSPSSSTSSA